MIFSIGFLDWDISFSKEEKAKEERKGKEKNFQYRAHNERL